MSNYVTFKFLIPLISPENHTELVSLKKDTFKTLFCKAIKLESQKDRGLHIKGLTEEKNLK